MAQRSDRRQFLKTGAGLLVAAGTLGTPGRGVTSPGSQRMRGNPFTLGVASGDPLPDAVVIWTRLAPEPLAPGGGMPLRPLLVRWEVAEDEGFRRITRHGWVAARPELAHAVHVDVEGLAPARTYWYRFRAAGQWSPTGRTRTAPPADLLWPRLRYAFASCQDYEDGLYTAWGHLAAEELDLVVFLGDYIYEGAPSAADDKVRRHAGQGETVSLDAYRQRYAQYKADPALQAAHAACPWVVTLDDHEVDNDWSGDIPQDPALQSRDAFRYRRAAAFQAYYEHMPLRLSARPLGPHMRLYRRLRFGALAEFHVLDTRQHRSVTEPCGYGTGPACPAIEDPRRTMLGLHQEAWLYRGLTRSRARWNVLAQQVPIMRLDVGGTEPAYKLDKWDAYPAARQRLLRLLASRQPANPLVITGDLHDAWVGLLPRVVDDPDAGVLASEFVATSISSDGDGAEASEEGIRAFANGRNPHLRFHHYRRGYTYCELTPERCLMQFRAVDYVSRPGAPLRTVASYVLEDGDPVARPA